MTERRYDVDWLRVAAMLAVFVFHCTRFFDTEGWHLKNAEQSFVLFVLVRGLMWPWIMELFFLLSGVGAWYALRSRTAGAFLVERIKRLLVPLYTVGLLVLLPPQFYFELVTNGGYAGAFREVLPRYFAAFDWPRVTPWPISLVPLPFAGHLWFLQFLFLISLVTLPLLLFLKSDRGRRSIDRLAAWCGRRGGVFVFVIPLAAALVALKAAFNVGRGWAEFAWYAIYFVLGYIAAADARFGEAFKRHAWVALALWLVGFFGGIGVLVLGLGYDPMPGREAVSILFVLFQVIWSIASFGAVVFVLSLGARYLSFDHRALAHANEAVLPFYLFHQTIILAVGWFVIPLGLPAAAKFSIIAVVSFIVIAVLYELVVRPLGVVRFIFGMRPGKERWRMKLRSAAVLAAFIVAAYAWSPCREGASAREPEKSSVKASISPAVRAAAKEIYHVVMSLPGTFVEEIEGTFLDEYTGRDLSVCMLLVSGAWSELAPRPSPDDTLFKHLSDRGWNQEPRFAADGPDGTYLSLSKDGIWCFIRGRWDGGDITDSTYVPSDAYQFIIYCAEFDGRGRNDPEDE